MYQDAIDDVSRTHRHVNDLDRDDRHYIARAYIKDACTDELFRIFTQEMGVNWARWLGMFITEDVGDEGVEMILGDVFEGIKDIVQVDLAKSYDERGPNETEIDRALDARDRLQAIPMFLRRQAG